MKITFLFFVGFVAVCLAEDYYDLLNIKRDATEKEIRQAFKKLAIKHHPDKNTDDANAHEKFVKFTKAYEVLKDPDLRKKYDLYGESGLDGNNQRGNYHSWNYYQNSFGIYDDDPQVITLNRHDYYDNVVDCDKIWLINFYSGMCSHCHHLAPIWRRVARELEGVIHIGAVNCEDDWQLCHQIGIKSYPTILHYPKNSKHGVRFTPEKTFDNIVEFVLDRLDVTVKKLKPSIWKQLWDGKRQNERPILVFTCGDDRDCFNYEDQLKITAILDKLVDVRIFNCDDGACDKKISKDTGVVYLPMKNDAFDYVEFEGIDTVHVLIEKVLENLPEPQDLRPEDVKKIQVNLKDFKDSGWLIYFYMGQATEMNLELKKLPSIVTNINLGKLNCARNRDICQEMSINRYPMWGVIKPGGAVELNHGQTRINDIAKFAENSIKAENVWALTSEKLLAIMQRRTNNEVWFLDWFAPWCPPCLTFLPELRKASQEFDPSVVRFGTVDCTVHSAICQQYNIRSYPTAMLINGTKTLQFTSTKNAGNVIQFIRESQNPTVISLSWNDFNRLLAKKTSDVLWIIDYFAPWCGPCQQLAPEWTAVAKALKDLTFLKVASIDCQEESALCGAQGVRSYPTIRLYPQGSEGLSTVALYNGQRDSLSLLKWVASFFPTQVEELNPHTLEKEIVKGKKIWLVDYYAPWCGHCQHLEPHFAIAAQLLKGKVKFGRVNCDIHRNQCSDLGIRGYPTMLFYEKSKGRRNLSKGVRIQSMTGESINSEVLALLNSSAKRKQEHDEL